MRIAEKGHPILMIVPAANVVELAAELYVDQKTLSGLAAYARFWPGSVKCIMRLGPKVDGAVIGLCNISDLPFPVTVLPNRSQLSDSDLDGATLVLASGDNWLDFSIAKKARSKGISLCFVIEYTLRTRLKIAWVSEEKVLSKIKATVWLLCMEVERRKALREAGSIQANGNPAAHAYAPLVKKCFTFFDTRLQKSELATARELLAREAYLREGRPLRLAYTGRLERMKGVEDLIEVARRIEVPFTLNIHGEGTLQATLSRMIKAYRLEGVVTLHPAVNFSDVLVPWLKTYVDIFVCCHVQSDPSCTYLETLGCGVPILGYSNDAWVDILRQSGAGWETALSKPVRMASLVNRLHADRAEIVHKMNKAIAFAANHTFEDEFGSRVKDLLESLRPAPV